MKSAPQANFLAKTGRFVNFHKIRVEQSKFLKFLGHFGFAHPPLATPLMMKMMLLRLMVTTMMMKIDVKVLGLSRAATTCINSYSIGP